jgi:hypothetical protein
MEEFDNIIVVGGEKIRKTVLVVVEPNGVMSWQCARIDPAP